MLVLAESIKEMGNSDLWDSYKSLSERGAVSGTWGTGDDDDDQKQSNSIELPCCQHSSIKFYLPPSRLMLTSPIY